MKKICLQFRTKYKLPIYDTLSFLQLRLVPGVFVSFFKNAFSSGGSKFWRTEVEPSVISTLQFIELVLWKSQNKVLSMHFLKLPTSGNNAPKKGDTPIITMDNTELSLWGTRYSWYMVFVLYSFSYIICQFRKT